MSANSSYQNKNTPALQASQKVDRLHFKNHEFRQEKINIDNPNKYIAQVFSLQSRKRLVVRHNYRN